MENTKLKRELIHAKNKRPSDFLGYMIGFISIEHGYFLIKFGDYLTTHSEPYLSKLPGQWVGLLLLLAGLFKAIGLVTRNKYLKEWTIWLLSAIWGGLWIVSLTYAFGTGYPDPYHAFMFFVFVACLRVSLKGDYRHDI